MAGSPKFIVGNWKMHGLRAPSLTLAGAVAEGARSLPETTRVVLCPPFTLLSEIGALLEDLAIEGIGHGAVSRNAVFLGAQDCYPGAFGAHTGDISAPMLADAGARYVILGHSERRTDHGETDSLVRRKVEAARAAGLVPIVCVGETLEQRRAGRAAEVLRAQIEGSLTDDFAQGPAGILAYEPVWAIGTGLTPTRDELAADARLLRELLAERLGARPKADDIRVPILYGGSVKASSAAEILSIGDVDGALVGGASLDAAEFLRIAEAA